MLKTINTDLCDLCVFNNVKSDSVQLIRINFNYQGLYDYSYFWIRQMRLDTISFNMIRLQPIPRFNSKETD